MKMQDIMKKFINKPIIYKLVLLIILLVAFILLLPVMPLPFGLKVRILTTNGMSHQSPSFNETAFAWFWKEKLLVSSIPFKDGFETGDLVVISTTDKIYSLGDVVSYPYHLPLNLSFSRNFKIHRISEYNGTVFSTLPDAIFGNEGLDNTVTLAKCSNEFLKFDNASQFFEIRKTYSNSFIKNCEEPFNGTQVQWLYAMVDFPQDVIEGKVIFKIPKIGMLQVLILCSQEPKCEFVPCLTTGNCSTRLSS